VPAELEAIVEKAMAREPEHRYSDTLELAEDLRAWLERRVVRAYETGAIAELRKWVVRNRGLAAALAGAVLSLVAGLTASLVLKAQSDRRADEVLRLSSLQKLEDLIAEADRLWPANPEQAGRFVDWLDRAEALLEERPDHEAMLARLRRKAIPTIPEDVAERTVSPGRTEFGFADPQDRWWHDQLAKLVAGLKALADPETGVVAGVSPEHGWGVKRRLDWARSIRQRTIDGEEASRLWSDAIRSIADVSECPKYEGLRVAPQLGLLPIGRDPASGLWEFAHLMTGEPAQWRADGTLDMKVESGLVFVLLPGGTFHMGAQPDDPSAPNHDPYMAPEEGPVHEVTLTPFFLSKFEMTQGQWQRFAGRNPSQYAPNASPSRIGSSPAFNFLHPVEQVSWNDCMELCRRMGLELPSEAQWEYAARAGTTTAWWTGDAKETLAGAGNIADRYAKLHGGPGWIAIEEWLDDGYWLHAPVGSFRANGFGLHDLVGNVWERCRDGFAAYDPQPATDPVADPAGSRTRVLRGGSFGVGAVGTRSAKRAGDVPDKAADHTGLRPARAFADR
jgi:formylglycine-generating enzyme required for sulfatase activity